MARSRYAGFNSADSWSGLLTKSMVRHLILIPPKDKLKWFFFSKF